MHDGSGRCQAYLRAGVGALLGVVLLREQFTWYVGAGVVLAILGVALINMPPGGLSLRRMFRPS